VGKIRQVNLKQRENTINIIPQGIIENKIFLIRGRKVMIDRDLASLKNHAEKGGQH